MKKLLVMTILLSMRLCLMVMRLIFIIEILGMGRLSLKVQMLLCLDPLLIKINHWLFSLIVFSIRLLWNILVKILNIMVFRLIDLLFLVVLLKILQIILIMQDILLISGMVWLIWHQSLMLPSFSVSLILEVLIKSWLMLLRFIMMINIKIKLLLLMLIKYFWMLNLLLVLVLGLFWDCRWIWSLRKMI